MSEAPEVPLGSPAPQEPAPGMTPGQATPVEALAAENASLTTRVNELAADVETLTADNASLREQLEAARETRERLRDELATVAAVREALQRDLGVALGSAERQGFDAAAAARELAEMRRTAGRVQDRKIHYREALERLADEESLHEHGRLCEDESCEGAELAARAAFARDMLGEAGDG